MCFVNSAFYTNKFYTLYFNEHFKFPPTYIANFLVSYKT